ncbi:MAG TPA: anthranilate synthase component I, partial [Conexibacter sp.]|nr:anthranilate synthase component I [Conexibacter sp.]
MASPAETAPAVHVTPSLEEVRELAREHNLIPLRHTFVEDCETPISAFLKLRGDGPAFLLESAEHGRVGRWSFIGVEPRSVLRWSLGDPGDPYALAAQAVARHRQAPLPDLPPFAGGAVGCFGYDLVRTVEPLGAPNPDPLGVPDLALMLTDVLVAFDHLRRELTILANVYAEDGEHDVERAYAAAVEAIADVRRRLAGPVPQPTEAPRADRAAPTWKS